MVVESKIGTHPSHLSNPVAPQLHEGEVDLGIVLTADQLSRLDRLRTSPYSDKQLELIDIYLGARAPKSEIIRSIHVLALAIDILKHRESSIYDLVTLHLAQIVNNTPANGAIVSENGDETIHPVSERDQQINRYLAAARAIDRFAGSDFIIKICEFPAENLEPDEINKLSQFDTRKSGNGFNIATVLSSLETTNNFQKTLFLLLRDASISESTNHVEMSDGEISIGNSSESLLPMDSYLSAARILLEHIS